ncbi:hypothetical protein IWX75_003566 [Arthrobacter sp. CAN_A6]|uniref:hypothetical protein n=1 Tax=Arthrobacter sp. CAN_A6 TaxID=2787721 RepID=UPI0018CA7CCC
MQEGINLLEVPNRRAQQPLGVFLIGVHPIDLSGSLIGMQVVNLFTRSAGIEKLPHTAVTERFKVTHYMHLCSGQQETDLMTGFGNCHTRTSLEQRVTRPLLHRQFGSFVIRLIWRSLSDLPDQRPGLGYPVDNNIEHA